MTYFNYFFNSIFERPEIYLFAIILIISLQTIVSMIITKTVSKFFNNSIRNKLIFSIIISIIVSYPGARFISNMMCFTATNEEQLLITIVFAMWFIALSTSNFLLISFIQKTQAKKV